MIHHVGDHHHWRKSQGLDQFHCRRNKVSLRITWEQQLFGCLARIFGAARTNMLVGLLLITILGLSRMTAGGLLLGAFVFRFVSTAAQRRTHQGGQQKRESSAG